MMALLHLQRQQRSSRWGVVKGLLGLAALAAIGMTRVFVLPLAMAEGAVDLASASAAHLTLLCATALCCDVGWRGGMSIRWNAGLQWLTTFPAPLWAIHVTRVVERGVLSPVTWWLLYPFAVGLLTHAGLFWTAPLAGLVTCLPVCAQLGVVAVVLEHLMIRLPTRLMQVVRILASVAGFAFLLGAPSRPDWSEMLRGWAWLPTTSMTAVLLGDGAAWLGRVTRFATETMAVVGLGFAAMAVIFRHGWEFGDGTSNAGSPLHSLGSATEAMMRWGMVGKDVVQLFRDWPRFFSTCLITAFPLASLALGTSNESTGGIVASPIHGPAVAFLAGAALVSLSATGALNMEGRSLWMTFTFPRTLVSTLFWKSSTWLVLSSVYTLAGLCWSLRYQPLSTTFMGGAAYALIGAVLCASLGTASSVHSCDLPTIERGIATKRGMASAVLLMGLMAAYATGFAASWRVRASLAALLAAVTYASWQGAAREMPFVLDRGSRRRPDIYLADGLSCALAFAALNAGIRALIEHFTRLDGWLALSIGFATAALIVGGGASYALHARGVEHLARRIGWVWSGQLGRSLRQGAAWAAPTIGFALLYATAPRWSSTPSPAPFALLDQTTLSGGIETAAFVTLALVVAPVAEEALFRGLIYRALRKALPVWLSALGSAAIFTVAHPGQSALPVFVVGVLAALAFERAGSLAAPILVHVAHNATLIAWAAL